MLLLDLMMDLSKHTSYKIIVLVAIPFILLGCESEYSRHVRTELASRQVYDSVFLNLEFRDSRDQFYQECWDLNKQGIVMQGPVNRTVQYMLKPSDSVESSIRMLYFPIFDEEDKIKEVEATLDYSAWSPWTRRYHSDSLLVAVQDTLMDWYGGNQFFKVEMDGSDKFLMVKVDGNRRIVVHKIDEKEVYMKVSDLTHHEVFNKNKEL